MNKLYFISDYMEGCHPNILKKLAETNYEQTVGYGFDEYTESAKNRIREACGTPNADVFFLCGGTQANATMIDALLSSYQGVITSDKGHISAHEAGAVEFCGHKVLTLPHNHGKISASQVEELISDYENDPTHEHMVFPGMVYITHPTEVGTLYTLNELQELSKLCRSKKIPLYLDGARLAYALSSPENEITLKDLGSLCDIFYIGGTKCGALFGEAVVITEHYKIPHMLSVIKQHGALIAKGRVTGIQFDELFKDRLYCKIGENAIVMADKIRCVLKELGYQLYHENRTNQVFFVIDNSKMKALSEQVAFDFHQKYDENHSVIRFATSWATKQEDTDKLISLLREFKK